AGVISARSRRAPRSPDCSVTAAMKTALLVLLALALAGCGGHAGGETTTTVGPQVALEGFFLRDGKVAAAEHPAPLDEPAAARRLLADGPTPLERAAGLTSEVPHATKFRLSVDNGTATVVAPPKPALSDAAAAQVVYTLTQFPSVRTVRLDGGNAGDRGDWERLTPPILVLTPVPGQGVTSPLHVAGAANTYEATFELELQDAKGKAIAHRVVTATSGSGTRGTFETELPFDDAKGNGTL